VRAPRTRVRLAVAALALLAGAAVLTLLASDVLRARSALRTGDAAFVASPGDATWTAGATFGGLGRSLLGVVDEVRYRQALQLYATIESNSQSFDNGASRSRSRGAAETALADVERRDHDPRRAARAAVILGVLAYSDPVTRGGQGPSPTDRAIAEFTNAIRLDPGNAAAKADLELILRLLVAHGERSGTNPGGFGPSASRKGAGLGTPGRGY
jgi:hypothetical protein